jgi:threonine/homoserine/homoserine lactone efflux protein
MTTYRGFASMPASLLWLMAAFFVITGLYEAMMGVSDARLEDVMLVITQLLAGAFLLYCAVQCWRDRRSTIASHRTTLIGYACFGLFCLCFLIKVGTTAVRIFN